MKMNTKQSNSIVRNESPDLANRGQTSGNISSDDNEK